MKAEIIAIGDEILIGQITDTNSGFMASRLNNIGVEISQITAISDSKEHIIEALDNSLERADIVLITGGLGPTNDDITKYTLADYFGTKLVQSEVVLDNIKELFAGRNISMNKQNLSQALVPEECTVLNNDRGTAPGMYFKRGEKRVFSMPGVPFEMQALFEEQVLPIIAKSNGDAIVVNKTVIIYNIPEAMLAEMLEEWERDLPDNFGLAYLPSAGLVKLRLTAKGDDRVALESSIEHELATLSSIVSVEGDDLSSMTIDERVSDIAKLLNITISTAESCTGGFIAHLITSIPGSSSFFKGSVVSYSNEIKKNVLKVSSDDLDSHGAVSQAVVEQMAEGVRELYNTDYAVSTSGIAGPDGGTEEKPVGTVWIAVSSVNGTVSKCFNFSKNRERNIEKSASMALDMLYKEIKNNA